MFPILEQKFHIILSALRYHSFQVDQDSLIILHHQNLKICVNPMTGFQLKVYEHLDS